MPRFLGIGVGTGSIDLSAYSIIKSAADGVVSTTSLTATGAFSTGQILFIKQMRGTNAGVYEDNQVASYAAGTITLVHPLENNYSSSGANKAQVVVVPDAAEYTNTLTVPAWDGDTGGLAVLACSSNFGATVDAIAKGFRGGAAVSGTSTGNQGEGSAGAGSVSGSSNGNGGGGGPGNSGGSRGAGGGGGGNAAAGNNGDPGGSLPAGGQGGTAVGDSTLATILMGGGGGSGGGSIVGGGESTGIGGRGGGVVVINAASFSGVVNVDGAVGLNPTRDGLGAGGAGAAGSFLLRTKNAVMGTLTTTALSKAGGAGIGPGPISGGSSSVGRIRIEACSQSGTTNPSASAQVGGQSYCGSILQII